MYRDSQHGLTIDISGPDGNAFVLLGYAQTWAKQLGWNVDKIMKEMQSGDYNHLLDVFEKHFKHIVTIVGREKDLEETED